jgi:hypothetical protein
MSVFLSSVMQKRTFNVFVLFLTVYIAMGRPFHCGKFITEFRELEGREEILCSEIVQRLNLSKNSEFIPDVDLNLVTF